MPVSKERFVELAKELSQLVSCRCQLEDKWWAMVSVRIYNEDADPVVAIDPSFP